MEIVEVDCPRSIDLKNIVNNHNDDVKYILQTVDIYDKIIFEANKDNCNGIMIKSNFKIQDDLNNKINNVINLFLNYTNISVDNLTIYIEKNDISILNSDYNIIAGIINGLNTYFNTNLDLHELMFLAKKIDNIVCFYLVCGYKKIDLNNKNYSIGENKFKKYYLIYNIEEEQLLKINQFVIDYKVDIQKNGNYYLIAIKENNFFKFPISLRSKDIYSCENVNKSKILKKYIK